MPGGPLVTVCVPTFNRAQMLRSALQSVLGQSYPNLEVIVSLKPTLVIVDDVHKPAAGALRDAGLETIECPIHSLPDVKKALATTTERVWIDLISPDHDELAELSQVLGLHPLVVEDILDFLRARRDALLAAGIERERISLDPGVGIGKTHQHNLTLVAHCGRFHELGCPVLIGHSRKGFLGKILGDKEAERDLATAGAALAAATQGVQVLRVHNVRVVREALLAFEACGGIDGVEAAI